MQSSRTYRWDWLAAGLILALMVTAASRLTATAWTENLFVGRVLALAGACLGLVLGISRFRTGAARLLSLAYTLVVVPWEITAVLGIGSTALDKLGDIWMRISTTAVSLAQKQKVDDPLLFIVFIALGFWLVGIVSGFGLTRHRNALAAILPSALAILIVQIYDPGSSARLWIVAAYLLFVLLLLGRLYLLDNQETWRAQHVFQLPETRADLTNGLMVISAVLILVAWSLPLSLSSLKQAASLWKNLAKPFEPLRKDIELAIHPLKSTGEGGGNNGASSYGDTLLLGRGISPSDDVVFTVLLPRNRAESLPRLYWRGRVFDTYTNGKWSNSDAETQSLVPTLGNLPVPHDNDRIDISLRYQMESPPSVMFMAAQPTWVNQPAKMLYNALPDGTLDIVNFASSSPDTSQVYLGRSSLANPSIEDMQAAGTNYPDWVTARYLQLPENFSPRIADLAAQIAAGQSTPYDQAAAVTNWLRKNISYESVLSSTPPQGSDPIVWMLFDYKKGFCIYYATSEVLMLRSLGIPARMSVGYAQGEINEDESAYTVRVRDYHAWPEVYFPSLGWVEFEPTTSQVPLERPLTFQSSVPEPGQTSAPNLTPSAPTPQPIQTPETVPPPQAESAPALWRSPIFLLSFFIFLLMLWLLDRLTGWTGKIPLAIEARAERRGAETPRWIQTWAAWTRLSPIARSYEMINLSLRLLGHPQPIDATPEERAARLSQLLPATQTQVQELTARHELALYAGVKSKEAAARREALIIFITAIWTRLLQLGKPSDEE